MDATVFAHASPSEIVVRGPAAASGPVAILGPGRDPPETRSSVWVSVPRALAARQRPATETPDAGSYAYQERAATFAPRVDYDAVSVGILYEAASGRLWTDDVSLEFVE